MALGEYGAAMEAVIGDLERMWRGFVDGRGGVREAGVRDLVRQRIALWSPLLKHAMNVVEAR